MATPQTEALSGIIERIVYYGETNGYCVAMLERVSEEALPSIRIAGIMPGIQCGETIKADGVWEAHNKYGTHFKIQNYTVELPSSVYGIRKYLESGLVQGIGKTYARKIVDHFQEQTLVVIAEESARLQEVSGIGKQRAKAIKEAWVEQRSVCELFMFLKTYGASNHHCLRIVKRYGAQAMELVRTDPYRLVHDFEGIGFKTADSIALNLGLPSDSPQRVIAGIFHVFKDHGNRGHTAVALEGLCTQVATLLGVSAQVVDIKLKHLLESGEMIPLKEGTVYQLKYFQDLEIQIAKDIGRISSAVSVLPSIDLEKALSWIQERCLGFSFSPEQLAALRLTLSEKCLILTGGPGTGKTSILRGLVAALRAKQVRFCLTAPTGRAAKRLSEGAGAPAQTVHRLLKYDPETRGFVYGVDEHLPYDYIIIDEVSMLDCKIAAALLAAIPSQANVLFVGDIHQLPSVGPGAFLNDLIQSEKIPIAALTKIFRQDECSDIIQMAHAILGGEQQCSHQKRPSPGIFKNLGDCTFLEEPDPEACLALTLDLCTKHLPALHNIDPVKDIQVLCPLHRGLLGTENLNQHLQKRLVKSAQVLPGGPWGYSLGDKVIQLRNNYDKGVFNGDLGFVMGVDQEQGALIIDFDGHTALYKRTEMGELKLAYAMSIHKSQGSEFPIVIMPIVRAQAIMLQRNLLYTGLTRGKDKVILVGDPSAYALAVRQNQTAKRQTGLLEAFRNSESITKVF